MRFKYGKAFAIFAMFSLILCATASLNNDQSFSINGRAEIDNDAIMNETGDAVEEGLPFVIQMAFIAAGVSVIMAALYSMMPKMGR